MVLTWSRLAPWLPLGIAIVLFVSGALTMVSTFATGIFPLGLVTAAAAVAPFRPRLSLGFLAGGGLLALPAAAVTPYWAITVGYGAVFPAIALALGVLATLHGGALRWWSLAAASVMGVAAAPLFLNIGLVGGLLSFIGLLALGLAAWGIGVAIHENAARLAALAETARVATRLQTSESDLALADERNRIAQEMHDVVAHSLAVIVAQADGARYLETTRPAAMASALEAIAQSARTALVDVQGMIDGIVDGTEAPQPTLAELDALLDGVRDAGLDVALTTAGDPEPLGPGQQAAVFRIVQEGLTNALRHRGRGSHADVVLDWRGPGLSIQLVSSGTGERSGESTAGSGRGIPGMAERARLAGGWLAAGLDDSGDHRTTAFVPFRSPEAGEHVTPAATPTAAPSPAPADAPRTGAARSARPGAPRLGTDPASPAGTTA